MNADFAVVIIGGFHYPKYLARFEENKKKKK